MATTQYGAGLGYGTRPYGSFAGKEELAVPAVAITQFWAGLGYGARRYGSFAGKEASGAGGGRRQRQIPALIRRRTKGRLR